MAENRVKLRNGQSWTAQQFLDHYRSAKISGTPTPAGDAPAPVPVDMSWYMGEGPGRFYHPGMFPVINQVIENASLGPGAYDLEKLASREDDLKARISHYVTAPWSSDYALRALVFGNESARIYGNVIVNPDGSKRFDRIEIRPHKTGFDFWPKTNNTRLEQARALARKLYDPGSLGVGYDIPIIGTGRVYDPFTDSELNAALRGWGSRPPGLLPSASQHRPLPYMDEHRRYLDQMNGLSPSMPQSGGLPGTSGGNSVPHLSRRYDSASSAFQPEPTAPAARSVLPGPSSSSAGLADWLAALAGVNPQSPSQPASPPQDDELRGFYRDDPAQPWKLLRQR